MNETGYVEGYEQPLHKSLTEQILMAGAPQRLVILNGGLAAMAVIVFKSWYVIPLNIILHLIAVWAAKKDPQFFECFIRYNHKKKYYST